MKTHKVEKIIGKPNAHGKTPLYLAVSEENLVACQKLYGEMDVKKITSTTTKKGKTVLHQAIKKINADIVKFLLKDKDVSKELIGKKDKLQASPLHYSMWNRPKEPIKTQNNNDIIDILIDRFKVFYAENVTNFILDKNAHGYSAGHIAAHLGNTDAILKLVQETKTVSEDATRDFLLDKDSNDKTLLYWSVQSHKGRDNNETTRQLLLIGKTALQDLDFEDFILNRTKGDGYTVLHLATQRVNHGAIQMFIELSADVVKKLFLTRDNYGQTALHWAIFNSKSREKNIQNDLGQVLDRLLEYARENFTPQEFKKFVEMKSNNGSTALSFAQKYGDKIAEKKIEEALKAVEEDTKS